MQILYPVSKSTAAHSFLLLFALCHSSIRRTLTEQLLTESHPLAQLQWFLNFPALVTLAKIQTTGLDPCF